MFWLCLLMASVLPAKMHAVLFGPCVNSHRKSLDILQQYLYEQMEILKLSFPVDLKINSTVNIWRIPLSLCPPPPPSIVLCNSKIFHTCSHQQYRPQSYKRQSCERSNQQLKKGVSGRGCNWQVQRQASLYSKQLLQQQVLKWRNVYFSVF